MSDFIIENEKMIRLVVFVGMLALMGLWEIFAPRRELTVRKLLRWTNNLGLVVLNTYILRWVFPAAAVGMAHYVEQNGWGLLQVVDWSNTFEIIIAVIILDFVVYLQHVMVHAVPALWRLHRVHHADLDYDVTTGLRFHPVEIILSMVIKFSAIAALGAPVLAVILFEVLLNGMAMFNHGNVRIPISVDKVIRWFIVTPDMHRVHHSVHDHEANSNFGFNISIWDRLFGTYRDQPEQGHQDMTIGIHKYREQKQVSWITGILTLPFKGKVSSYAINRRSWNDEDE